MTLCRGCVGVVLVGFVSFAAYLWFAQAWLGALGHVPTATLIEWWKPGYARTFLGHRFSNFLHQACREPSSRATPASMMHLMQLGVSLDDSNNEYDVPFATCLEYKPQLAGSFVDYLGHEQFEKRMQTWYRWPSLAAHSLTRLLDNGPWSGQSFHWGVIASALVQASGNSLLTDPLFTLPTIVSMQQLLARRVLEETDAYATVVSHILIAVQRAVHLPAHNQSNSLPTLLTLAQSASPSIRDALIHNIVKLNDRQLVALGLGCPNAPLESGTRLQYCHGASHAQPLLHGWIRTLDTARHELGLTELQMTLLRGSI